ncbi:MAG: helix-turn-helix transcriptional regulator [Candidatus Aminicenantes bacterium]|nr:helix-turn-helix transcriptional regulator [Candidatus Aminicenantes bacterium]
MISKALLAASTKPMILSFLREGESYGYEIIQSIRKISGGSIEWSDAMLYPVLHRMERDGLIASEWKMSREGRPRKYYSITAKGRTDLEADMKQWMKVHSALVQLWKTAKASD